MVTLCNTSFTWTIKNFVDLDRTRNELFQSCRIRSIDSSGPEFSVAIRPWGFPRFQDAASDGEEYVAIYLLVHNVEGKSYNIRYSFAILDVSLNKTYLIREERAITMEGESCGNNFIKRADLLRNSRVLLPDRKLTIFVEVSIMNDQEVYLGATEAIAQQQQVNMEELPRDLWKLYESGDYADRCFVVGGERMMAHSVILAARSAAISRLFADGSSEVIINDIEPDVFKGVLQFIYTEIMVQNLDERAEDLLKAANLFEMSKLKQRAEAALIQKIAVSNVARLLIMSFQHDALHLRDRAMNYLIEHKREVKGTPGWKDLSRYPEIMFELFASI